MATAKGLLLRALEEVGEGPGDIECCFYTDNNFWREKGKPLVQCCFAELPEREFDSGYGGTEGESVIAFSARYVYVRACYDGSEWMEAVPRHPAFVTNVNIPEIGGG